MPLSKIHVFLPSIVSRTCLARQGLNSVTNAPLIRSLHNSGSFKLGSPVGDPENKGSRQLGVNFDTLGTWDNRMNVPINMEESIRRGKPIPILELKAVGAATLKGRRKENEDRFKIQPLTKDVVMFSVYDGHGGALAADYANDHMEEHIKAALESGEKDLEKILYNAFVDINATFTKYLYTNFDGDDSVLSAGATATVCLLQNNYKLSVAHVGDSRAILCRGAKAVTLTKDHELEDPAEKKRIEDCGGKVTWNSFGKSRVNGRLDMTRSIGDVSLKHYGVIAEPDTKTIEIKHYKDAFLVLTTDGVSFVLADNEVVSIVSRCRCPQEAANIVADQALHFGSQDNATAVIVPFGAWGKFVQDTSAIEYNFGRNLSMKD